MTDHPRDDPSARTIERLVNVVALPIGRWDRDARLVFCNSPYLMWSGRARDDLIGRTLSELYGDEAWERARPAFERAFRGATTSYERLLGHGTLAGRWARIQVFPDADAAGEVHSVFTIATDIHEDVTAREALVAARVRLDRFTENIPYPLTYVDAEFVLRFVNKAYCDMAGKPADQLLGRHIGAVRGQKRWAEHEPHFRRALEGKTVQYTRLVDGLANNPGGGPRWLRTSYVPDFDERGQVVGLYTVTIDVHDLTVAQEQLRRSVERDTLTDVLSRRTMMDRIEAAMVTATHEPVALFFVDLDGFKAVNDRLGHREGDALLVKVAQALQKSVRADDAVGRFGGDEFLVLASVRSAIGAQTLAKHMLEAIREVSAGVGGGVSASIGYALAPADAQHPLKLLQTADDAMYVAKRLGKDRVQHAASRSELRSAATPPA